MAENKWFSTWFDTEYYHILYKNRDYKEAEQFINGLVNYLSLPEESEVLDLACGKGRHSVTLFANGFRVLGVDLSPNSIEEASKFSNDQLSFKVHDMRQPINGAQFDCIFNLFTSFGYFDDIEDNLRVLLSINQMLKSEGKFVIDFLNAHKVISTLVPYEEKEIDGITFKISKSFENGFIIKNISFEDKGEQFEFQEKVQGLTLEHFKLLLEKVDLEITDVFGDYDLNAYQTESSNRLIIVGKKK